MRGRGRQPAPAAAQAVSCCHAGTDAPEASPAQPLIALMRLCSCQRSGEAKITMTSSPLRTSRSHQPRPCSPWRKPRSASTSAPGCWCPSTGRNWGWPPLAFAFRLCLKAGFCLLSKIAPGTGTPVRFPTESTRGRPRAPWGPLSASALSSSARAGPEQQRQRFGLPLSRGVSARSES